MCREVLCVLFVSTDLSPLLPETPVWTSSRQNSSQKQGILISHRTVSVPTLAESCLKIKFHLNKLFKPLAPHRVRLRFIPFSCSLGIIWLITVTCGPAEEWKTWFSFPFLVFGGLCLVWPFMTLLCPHSPGPLQCCKAILHPSPEGPSCLQHLQISQSCQEHIVVPSKHWSTADPIFIFTERDGNRLCVGIRFLVVTRRGHPRCMN